MEGGGGIFLPTVTSGKTWTWTWTWTRAHEDAHAHGYENEDVDVDADEKLPIAAHVARGPYVLGHPPVAARRGQPRCESKSWLGRLRATYRP